MQSLLEQLETPHAVVDVGRVRENIQTVQRYASEHGLGLRPHAKTHKDALLGRMQVEAGALGLTVATAREAEVMARAAQRLLVAYPPVDPGRVERLMGLPSDVELSIALDSAESLKRLAEGAARHGRTVDVLIELDLGARRTGLDRPDEVVALARAATSSHTRFAGLMLHPGHLRRPAIDPAERGPESRPNRQLIGRLQGLRQQLSSFLSALEKAGLPCPVVSGGNSPTLFQSHLVPELTEIRPGTYVYADRDLASQGVMPWSSIAYSVLSTVVSTAVSGQAVIDAGTKALGREAIDGLTGYGALLDDPEVRVVRLSEEHGVLDTSESARQLRVGDRVRVVPNHVCVSVQLQERIAHLDGESLDVRLAAARDRSRLA
jgi:D-serine deaminase-like pyridoxal phosphate-dependent protein